MDCKYCNRKFANKTTLKTHQNTAKYCLKLQHKNTIDNIFKCEDCCKNFTSKYNLNKHKNICSVSVSKYKIMNENLENELAELRDYKSKCLNYEEELLEVRRDYERKIQILQDKLENVAIQAARRPTHNTYNRNNVNTIIQNMAPLTDEHFKDNSQHLTIEHLKQGVKGYVEYALKYPLKNKVLCVDYSRRKIKYKNGEGKVETDPEMARLSRKFFESIADKNRVLAADCVHQLSDDMDAVEKMKIMADMGQLMVDVNQSARGSKTDFTHDFVRGVCSKSVC